MQTNLTCLAGNFRGSYILRTLGASEFNYDRAKGHLMNLNLDGLGSRTMHFNTVAEENVTDGIDQRTDGHGQGKLMRLATWVNLDSRLSVSLNCFFLLDGV